MASEPRRKFFSNSLACSECPMSSNAKLASMPMKENVENYGGAVKIVPACSSKTSGPPGC
jgi:hypothetical protein